MPYRFASKTVLNGRPEFVRNLVISEKRSAIDWDVWQLHAGVCHRYNWCTRTCPACASLCYLCDGTFCLIPSQNSKRNRCKHSHTQDTPHSNTAKRIGHNMQIWWCHYPSNRPSKSAKQQHTSGRSECATMPTDWLNMPELPRDVFFPSMRRRVGVGVLYIFTLSIAMILWKLFQQVLFKNPRTQRMFIGPPR